MGAGVMPSPSSPELAGRTDSGVMKAGELALSHHWDCSTRERGLIPWLALMAKTQASQPLTGCNTCKCESQMLSGAGFGGMGVGCGIPEGMRAAELTLLPADGSTG